MPMIDLYTPLGTFADVHDVAVRAATIVKNVEQVPDIPMFRDNTAAFVHELPPAALSDAAGAGDHVRVQVLTNAGALDRDKQLAVVAELTDLVVEASEGRIAAERVWVLLTEATPGGWGLWGHAHTNEEIVEAARAEIGRLQTGG
jgi:phenylpyruvate tautomerase PptA (4-oxalocrotonate tautomerase family)